MKVHEITIGSKKVLIDPEFSHLRKYRWWIDTGYASRTKQIDNHRYTIKLHHAIIGFPLYGKQVDHINGNRLDNRLEILRIVTPRENNQNKPIHRSGKKTSQYIGVCWHKTGKKWMAGVRVLGKSKYLGLFDDEKLAYDAYLKEIKNLKKSSA